MARFNLEYYSGKDSYSDGDIEEKILEIVKENKALDDLSEVEVSYPVLYHLSHVRQNILLWYPFEKDARVLEVGSGCGALTSLLCEKVKSVTSVELSKRRASINYERNKQYDNLEIIVGNLNDIVFSEGFDYIILNGVFEYAASFTEGDTPYETFLASMAERLKPSGTILIAIENRLGAKYFAGAPEDHVNQYFTGINQYPGIETVRTFSKTEFESLCENTGLICGKFYYPYPDYKFPYEIFTDKTINSSMYGNEMFQFDENRLDLIKEDKLNKSLAKEGVADKFANSFLVEIRKMPGCAENEIDYVKMNADRAEDFRIYTTIWENDRKEKYVTKYPLGEKSKKHVSNMWDNAEKSISEKWQNLSGVMGENGEIIYPYLKEATLNEEVDKLTEDRDVAGIETLLKKLQDTFFKDAVRSNEYMTEEFKSVFGTAECQTELRCVKNANIDIILNNIFVKDEKYVLIDTEWIFPFMIPSEYIMWRVINEMLHQHQKLYQMVEYYELLGKFGIKEELEETFRAWEMHFAYEYAKGHGLKKYAKPMLEMKKIINEKRHCSKMYLDLGQSYNEEDVIYSKIEYEEGNFLQIFKLPEKKIVKLRWDPLEKPCLCHITEIRSEGSKVHAESLNAAYTRPEQDVFLTMDPNYEIRGSFMPGDVLEIRGRLTLMSEEMLVEAAEPLWKKDETWFTKVRRKIRG